MAARTSLVALIIGLFATPSPAQAPPATSEAVATAWLDLVAAGQADATWHQASQYFQERVAPGGWSKWVEAQHNQLRELRSRKVLESATGRDQSDTPTVEWAAYLFAGERPAGGRIMQRVGVARIEGGEWVVYDYGIWPDPAAVVANAYVEPVPYSVFFLSRRSFFHRFRSHPPPPGRPAPPPRNVANPRTFPKPPPPPPPRPPSR